MGGISSKSPLERRNTVLRRSQRKSVHSTKGKAEKLIKDIKKFKGTEEDSAYIELKARIETLERDLKLTAKNLQPQIRGIYNDTLKKTENCYQLLSDKLAENIEKAAAKKQGEDTTDKREDDNDDVFVETTNEQQIEQPEDSSEKRKTVELKLIQVEPIEASPQFNKRASLLKVGIPVMPGAIMDDLNRRAHDLELGSEGKIAQIRKRIEELELTISQFVGKKNGKHYNGIKEQLEGFANDLKAVPAEDEDVAEQIQLCSNYVSSCLSFLDEKAVEEESESEDSSPEGFLDRTGMAYVPSSPPGTLNGIGITYPRAMSPGTMKTTYI